MKTRTKEISVVLAGLLALFVVIGGIYALEKRAIQWEYKIVPDEFTMTPAIVSYQPDPIVIESSYDSLTSFDTGSDLTVIIETDISLTLTGTDDFTSFACMVELREEDVPIYSGTVTKALATDIISSVAVGDYDVYLWYSYTAGSLAGSGTVELTID